ncbi:hypothetical protein CFIICLFH_0548 [Methylobacterium goesingense]|nr:hypothetical protein CFIICLFH_0548 [Methylobacterium goesingense]
MGALPHERIKNSLTIQAMAARRRTSDKRIPRCALHRSPLQSSPMTVLALVVVGNILLASLFSLIAVAAD